MPIFDRYILAPADGVLKGAYILSKEQGSRPDIILISTGSEVQLVVEAQHELKNESIDARVVSMPSWELFRMQKQEYRNKVLPSDIKPRLAVEAASPQGWCEWVGDQGKVIGISEFGSSAPYKEIYEHYGITVKNIVRTAKKLIVEN
jgi:transketolase